MHLPSVLSKYSSVTGLTVALQALPCQAPEQRATVLAKRWALVVVDFKPVRHIYLEPLLVELQERDCSENPFPAVPGLH